MRAALNRPDTCFAPDRAAASPISFLHQGGRSLIAVPPSSLSFTLPARVMVLFAVSAGCRNIWSGPEDRHCKVHNGLTLTRAHRPAAQLPAPSPRGDACCRIRRGSMSYAALAGAAQRNGSPDRQTLCRMTDSLRAKATRALPEPERRSIASAQSFRCSGRFTR
jgi:hypothetical protein